MPIPLQISLHGMTPTDALQGAIRRKAERLERYYDRIIACRVVLELTARHQRKGWQHAVHIKLKVPGGELAVTREHDENLQVALREAFSAARRRLEDYARVQRGDVKRHARPRAAQA